MNSEVDINSIDEAIDAIALLIEEDNKNPTEAISMILKRFTVSKEDLLKEFESAFLCKPEEYKTICDEDNNWSPDIDKFDSFDDEDDEDDENLDLVALLG